MNTSNTKIISTNGEFDGIAADTAFTLPDTTPQGRVVGVDENLTQLFLTEEGLEAGAGMQAGVRLVRPLGEPVRQIAENFRQQLHEFIHSHIRPPTRYGFHTSGAEPIDVDGLVDSCRQFCQELEGIFRDRGAGDGLTINVRTLAHRVQSSLEMFLVSMVRRQTTHGIGEGDLDQVLHECIALKGDLGTTMQQLDAMNAEYQAALMEQYQISLQGRAGNEGRRQ